MLPFFVGPLITAALTGTLMYYLCARAYNTYHVFPNAESSIAASGRTKQQRQSDFFEGDDENRRLATQSIVLALFASAFIACYAWGFQAWVIDRDATLDMVGPRIMMIVLTVLAIGSAGLPLWLGVRAWRRFRTLRTTQLAQDVPLDEIIQ